MLPRFLRLTVPTLAALACFAAGCTAPEPAVKVDPNACTACGPSEFCCLGQCLSRGSSCGVRNGGAGGTNGAGGAGGTNGAGGAPSDPCAPHGNASVVSRACADATTFTTCPIPSSNACNKGYVCTEWVDDTGHLEADCVDPWEKEVCDPMTYSSHCEGTSAVVCTATPWTTGVHPPGFRSTADCPALYGPNATCIVGANELPTCDDPTAIPCDPATYAASCASVCALGAGGKWVVKPFSCFGGEQCVFNASTGGQPQCVPASATPSNLTPTPTEAMIQCVGTDFVHVQQYGYEWDRSCDEGNLGNHQICYDPPGAPLPHCIPATAETCDPATAPVSCLDATEVHFCTSDYYYDNQPCFSTQHCNSGKCCDDANPMICF